MKGKGSVFVIRSFLARHSEELQFLFWLVVCLAVIAFLLWLARKIWRNRARTGDFVRWFLGMRKDGNDRPGNVRKRHGFVILFFDIFALCMSVIATAAVSGAVLGPAAAILQPVPGIIINAVHGEVCRPPAYDGLHYEEECNTQAHKDAYNAARRTSSMLEIIAGTIAWVFGVLAFLFIAPRMFRFVRTRYLE